LKMLKSEVPWCAVTSITKTFNHEPTHASTTVKFPIYFYFFIDITLDH
jgi:hypothetical protein